MVRAHAQDEPVRETHVSLRRTSGVWRAVCLPLVAGCHLFEGFAIDCVAGQECARHSGETGGDTGDSGPPAPTSGWIVSVADSNDAYVYVYDANGEQLKAWTGLAAAFGYPETLSTWAGAVAYNRLTGAGIAAVNGSWATLDSQDDIVTPGITFDDGTDITDVEYADDNYYWFAVHDDVYAYDIRAQLTHSMFSGGLVEATGIGMGDRLLFAADWADGHPDVFALAVNHTSVDTIAVDVPGDPDLSRNPFAGPEDAPYGCTLSGAIYAIDGLADGSDTSWVAHLDEGLADVTDCGWDPGDGSWLLASASTGIWRLAADGTATNVAKLPRTVRGLRANFYR